MHTKTRQVFLSYSAASAYTCLAHDNLQWTPLQPDCPRYSSTVCRKATIVELPSSSPPRTPPPLPHPRRPPVVPIPRHVLMRLTVGVAGTVLFLTIYLIEGATRPGYNAWQQTISSLSFGPGGWLQR